MKIVRQVADPSREDAVRLTRTEKMGMIVLAWAATVLDDLQKDMAERLKTIPEGAERMEAAAEQTDKLLCDLRLTVPMNQRKNLSNTAMDFEMRLVPKLAPGSQSVICTKEEFRELVDYARAQCRECTLDDEECGKCGLYQLLTVLLPVEDYHGSFLCPYNMGEWKN